MKDKVSSIPSACSDGGGGGGGGGGGIGIGIFSPFLPSSLLPYFPPLTPRQSCRWMEELHGGTGGKGGNGGKKKEGRKEGRKEGDGGKSNK